MNKFRAVYKNSLLPSQTFQHLESKWPCTQDDFVLKETELGLLSDEDSINLLNANFPLLQVREFLPFNVTKMILT